MNFKNFIYYFKGSIKDIGFNGFFDAYTLFDDIKFKIISF